MRLRSTHTFVELAVSREAYLEIYTLLAEAGYHHAFIDGAIDMHGIALTMKGGNNEEGKEGKEGKGDKAEEAPAKTEKVRLGLNFDPECKFCAINVVHFQHNYLSTLVT